MKELFTVKYQDVEGKEKHIDLYNEKDGKILISSSSYSMYLDVEQATKLAASLITWVQKQLPKPNDEENDNNNSTHH